MCNEGNEPKGSLSNPPCFASPSTPNNVRSTLRALAKENVQQRGKRRDFRVRQGRPKRQPGDILVYVEERTRRTDAAWHEKNKFSWRV